MSFSKHFFSSTMDCFKSLNINCKNIHCTCQWTEYIFNNNNKRNNYKKNKNNIVFNKDYFWENINRFTDDKINSLNFYNKHSFTLGNEKQTIVSMGINPKENFSFRCEIICETSGKSVVCNLDGLQKIFLFLHELFLVNVCHPKTVYNSTIHNVDNYKSKKVFKITRYYQKVYKIRVGSTSIIIDEKNLKELLELESFIHQIIDQLQTEKIQLEKNFFNLLFMYCQQHKEMSEMLEYHNFRNFLNEMITSPCGCVPKRFITETAIYFCTWINLVCLPTYFKILMFDEEKRLDSFKDNWPHSYLDVRTLAKTGLYWIGPCDRVKCAFCAKEIEKWEAHDNPIKDHYKFAPYCPLLNRLPTENNELKTSNSLNLNECIQSSYDEVDCKSKKQSQL